MIIIISNKKRILKYLGAIAGSVLLAFGCKSIIPKDVAVYSQNQKAYVAVIIDDFGNNSKGTEEMLNLDIKFTGAVMPFMPNTENEAQLLHNRGKDVILHMPMEAHTGQRSWLGQTPILNEYSPQKAVEILDACVKQVAYSVGMNNHMGSKVMENEEIMDGIFSYLKDKNFIFIDSMTTGKSKAKEMAEKYDVDYISRDVFLDSTQDLGKIEQNLKKAGKIALEKGYAVAIGHVGAEGGIVTAKAIENTYKELEEQGVEFIGISELNEKIKKIEKK